MNKLQKMIDAYNNKATKWGYETLTIENGELKGRFILQLPSSKGILSELKSAYRNGYMEEDYNKIVNRLRKVNASLD